MSNMDFYLYLILTRHKFYSVNSVLYLCEDISCSGWTLFDDAKNCLAFLVITLYFLWWVASAVCIIYLAADRRSSSPQYLTPIIAYIWLLHTLYYVSCYINISSVWKSSRVQGLQLFVTFQYPAILLRRGIWGSADEAVLNKMNKNVFVKFTEK